MLRDFLDEMLLLTLRFALVFRRRAIMVFYSSSVEITRLALRGAQSQLRGLVALLLA